MNKDSVRLEEIALLEQEIKQSKKDILAHLMVYVFSAFLTVESYKALVNDVDFMNICKLFLFTSLDVVSFYRLIKSVVNKYNNTSLKKYLELQEELGLPVERMERFSLYKK